jgi:hypothetical protein
MLIRSLYLNDKINILQEKGIFHFEKEARIIDGQNGKEKVKQKVKEKVKEKGEKLRENVNRNYENTSSGEVECEISSENYTYNLPHQEPFYFINEVGEKYREKRKSQVKQNAQNMVKKLR